MASTAKLPAPQEAAWGELGPAMRALPNDKWRNFVWHLCTSKPGHGALTRAYKVAGFGARSSNAVRVEAHRLSHDDRIIAAIAEVSKKVLRVAHPNAVKAITNMVLDPDHPGHVKATLAVLDRTDPVIARHDHHVTHEVIDRDQEDLKELEALRHLETPREKLLELYGGNGLARLERLEAAERAAKAKVIDAEFVEVEGE